MPAACARILVAGACFAMCAAAIAAPVSAIDDRGVLVELSDPATRIVAIAPHLAELVHAAGGGERLIAVVRGSDYPAAVALLPVVGDAFGLDYERLLAMKPDLVLAWGSGNRPADLRRLADRGIPLFVAEPQHLGDIARHLRAIGTLIAASETADAAARRFERRIEDFRLQSAQLAWLTAFVEIWPQPLITVGPQHLISETLGLCRARNVLRDYPLPSGPVPMEAVVFARPDVIVSVSDFGAAAAQSRWRRIRSLNATDKVVSVDPDLLTRATPRLLLGAESLCAALQAVRQTLTH